MSIKLTRRVAADLLGRGTSAVRIKEDAIPEAEKAITRDDVRALIQKGLVYAEKKKHNISAYGKILKEKRGQGRKRGTGKRRGTEKARASVEYKKRVRAQRRVLAQLKQEKAFNNEKFKEFYRLVKGGTFASKASLLGHIKGDGIQISDEQFKKLKHI